MTLSAQSKHIQTECFYLPQHPTRTTKSSASLPVSQRSLVSTPTKPLPSLPHSADPARRESATSALSAKKSRVRGHFNRLTRRKQKGKLGLLAQPQLRREWPH